MSDRTTTHKALKVILLVVLGIVVLFTIMVVASIALWTGDFSVSR